ncbi:ABC transporter substrate-binding protein [Rhodococcus rhodochrous]|uniref:ABC transporter substrate-binding protein n=1 Tax=Rhodococcus rhodochrous TaxID=1829 RepID=UPI000AF94E1D|nr:ABC transporter substrate-binding protein [Rhodococcus rhodochrous]MDJ0399032.1 ABC transporter substrate-binding protein [Rhodococcus rhodochrous]MDO1486024.1 ABC transporter substrate-binding protein [Rhodococcus rhodochrous]SNV24164.1 ABC transporter substrate-binding protein [Rhodococcus rhodochrous]
MSERLQFDSSILSRLKSPAPLAAGLVAAVVALTGCSSSDQSNDAALDGEVTVENCGTELTFPSPATAIYANDSQILLNLLALDADDHITAVSGIRASRLDQLRGMYGTERIDELPFESEESFNLESIQAQKPDVVMAGYGWGFSVEKNITPERLNDDFGIPAYTVTPTCLPGSVDTMSPWDEAFADLSNIGAIVGHDDIAAAKIEELRERRGEMESAPRAEDAPTVMYITSVSNEGVSSAGKPHLFTSIIEVTGARNALDDVDEKSPKMSWESVTAANPDFIVLTDTGDGAGAFEAKLTLLSENPATRSLDAITQGRVLNLPTDMGRSGALMMDTAEHVRKALEQEQLLPQSEIEPRMDLSGLE